MTGGERATRKGYAEGRSFLSFQKSRSLSFSVYLEEGRTQAAMAYKREEFRAAYLLGWRSVGDQLRPLFQPDDLRTVQVYLEQIRCLVGLAAEKLACLLEWQPDSEFFHESIEDAYNTLDDVQHTLDMAAERLT